MTEATTTADPPAIVTEPVVSTTETPAPAENDYNADTAKAKIDKLTAEKWDERRQRESIERELKLTKDTLEELQRSRVTAPTEGDPPAPTQPQTKALTPAELRALVVQETHVQDFNRQCNEGVAKGRSAHADFDKVVLGDLANLSPMFDSQLGKPVLPQTLVEAAVATGAMEEVLYALGKDTALADRVMQMTPARQTVELTRLADKLARATAADTTTTDEPVTTEQTEPEARNVSRAPAPIRPKVGASARTTPTFSEFNTEHFDTAEWIRQREAKLHANGARRR